MKWIGLVLVVFVSASTCCQNTFGNIYDIEESAIRNSLIDIKVLKSQNITNSTFVQKVDDAAFIDVGNGSITSKQLSEIDNNINEAVDLSVLNADQKDFSNDLRCEEVISLEPPFKYNIGDQWYYEEVFYIGGGNRRVGFETISIQDSIADSGKVKYVLSNQDTFYVENGKMYFWDAYFQEYIMYFNWNEENSYTIKYYDSFKESEAVATVIIDSITNVVLDEDTISVQHVKILNSGTVEEYFDLIYEGIGARKFDIKFLLGCSLCDFNPTVTDLRCFINQDKTYQFSSNACDSTFLITNTVELEAKDVTVFPNPTYGLIYIDGIGLEGTFQVYTHTGSLIQSGRINNNSIDLKGSGLLILRMNFGKEVVFKRILKLE